MSATKGRNIRETVRVPPVVDPNAVYDRHQLRRLLRVRLEYLTEAVGAGKLRAALVGKRYAFLGSWVLDWISACQVHRTAGAGSISPAGEIDRNGKVAHHGKED